MSPEIIVILINAAVVVIAYFIVYPKFCGSDGNKIAANDLFASGVVLFTSGSIYWGTGQPFSLLLFDVNWFWFTLATYAALEIPVMLWYFRKHNVWSSFTI